MALRARLPRALALLLLCASVSAGCSRRPAAPPVWIAPRVELAALGNLGMIEFSGPRAGEIGALASREFLSALQHAQPGTPVLELGDARAALNGSGAISPEAVRALAARHGIDAVVVGVVEAQRVSPKLAFDTFEQWVSASAQLEGALSVRILDTRTGATLWSTTTNARQDLAHVAVSGGEVSGVGAKPMEEARAKLVRRLVGGATGDFWGHWD